MAKVAAQEEKVMIDGRLFPTPLGNQLRGDRVAKIMKTRTRPCSVGDEVSGQPAERIVYSRLAQWMAAPSDKESIGQQRMPPPNRLIAPERAHGGRMKRQDPFRAEFGARHSQGAGLRIEVGFLQTKGLPHAQAGAGDQADERDVGDCTQRIGCLGWECSRPAEDKTNLIGRVDVGREPTMRLPNQSYWRHFDAGVEDSAVARKPP